MKLHAIPTALLALMAAAMAITSVAQAQDSPDFEAAVKRLAEDIQRYASNESEDRIALGSFDAPASLAASSGRAIKDALEKELKDRGLTMSRTASLECRGEYFFDFEDKTLAISCELVESRTRAVRKRFDTRVFDVDDIAKLLGVSGSLSVASVAQRTEDLAKAVDNPEVALQPNANATLVSTTGGQAPVTRISAQSNSPFGIEVGLIDANGAFQPVPVANDQGIAFVDLPKGAAYGIRVFNTSGRLAAVEASIDGLNMFHFSEVPAYRAFGKVIVPPSDKGGVIRGWHKDNATSYQFAVGEAAEAAAAQTGAGPNLAPSNDRMGTITVSFAVAVSADEPLPADELIRTKGLGTVKGQEVAVTFGEKKVRVGAVREVVSVRYSR